VQEESVGALKVRKVAQHVKEGLLLPRPVEGVGLNKVRGTDGGAQNLDATLCARSGGATDPHAFTKSFNIARLLASSVPNAALTQIGFDPGVVPHSLGDDAKRGGGPFGRAEHIHIIQVR